MTNTRRIRNADELMTEIAAHPRLLAQILRFADLSLRIWEDGYTGKIFLNCAHGVVGSCQFPRVETEDWKEELSQPAGEVQP